MRLPAREVRPSKSELAERNRVRRHRSRLLSRLDPAPETVFPVEAGNQKTNDASGFSAVGEGLPAPRVPSYARTLDTASPAVWVLGMAEIPREKYGGDGRIRTAE